MIPIQGHLLLVENRVARAQQRNEEVVFAVLLFTTSVAGNSLICLPLAHTLFNAATRKQALQFQVRLELHGRARKRRTVTVAVAVAEDTAQHNMT